MIKGNVIYGQSGGPTSIINSSFYGLILALNKYSSDKFNKLYAMHYGIEGLLNEELILIDTSNPSEYKRLLNTPGAYVGSNRYKLDDYKINDKDYKKILEIFKKFNIRYFFYNGGNDSMDTVNKIGKYLKLNGYACQCIGIPKTIDNDLVNTDFSFGFPSAAKFIINSLINIYYDYASYKEGRVNIVEIMGRNAGWLTASALYSEIKGVKIDLIYLPEFSFNLDDFLNKVNEIYSKQKHCLVVVSEGIKDKNGNFLFEANNKLDDFNHNSLGGVSHHLAQIVSDKLKLKVRSIEFSLLQRANSFSPSKTEQKLALKCSEKLIKDLINNKDLNLKMITIKYYEKSNRYSFNYVPLNSVANKERKMDSKYLNLESNEIKKEYLDYISRLIKGDISTFDKDGLIDVMPKLTK